MERRFNVRENFIHQSRNVGVDHALEWDPIDELLYRIKLVRWTLESPLALLNHEALFPEVRVEALFAGFTESKPAREAHNGHFLLV